MVYIMNNIIAKEKKWIIKDDPKGAAEAAIARISDKMNTAPFPGRGGSHPAAYPSGRGCP